MLVENLYWLQYQYNLTLNPLLKIIDLSMYLLLDNGGVVHNTLKDKISRVLFPLKCKNTDE